MRIRTLAIMLTRSLLSMFIFSIIFISISDFQVNKILGGVFEDIYIYADNQSQKDAIEGLVPVCDKILEGDDSLKSISEVCGDNEALAKIKENCDNYYIYLEAGDIEREPELEKSCKQVLSGELEDKCDQIKGSSGVNLTKSGEICEQHRNKIIGDGEFFSRFMLSASVLPGDNIGSIEKFHSKDYLIPISLIAFILTGILFLLHKENFKELLFSIGRILFNMGIFFIIVTLILLMYRMIFPINTSLILNSLGSNPGDAAELALPVLLPLIFGKIFGIVYLIAGGVLAIAGLSLKIAFKEGKV